MNVTAERSETTYTITLNTHEMRLLAAVVGNATRGGTDAQHLYTTLLNALKVNGEYDSVISSEMWRGVRIK